MDIITTTRLDQREWGRY